MSWGLSLSLIKFEGLELVLKLFFIGLDPTLVTVALFVFYVACAIIKSYLFI